MTAPATTCATCRFYEPKQLECRRHTPSIVATATETLRRMWPIVYDTDWCGEHEPFDCGIVYESPALPGHSYVCVRDKDHDGPHASPIEQHEILQHASNNFPADDAWAGSEANVNCTDPACEREHAIGADGSRRHVDAIPTAGLDPTKEQEHWPSS